MKRKKSIFIIALGILLIFLIIFIFFNYKNLKDGNTIINKSEENVENYILNMNSYAAIMEIEITTNKNKNKYVVRQELKNNKESIQEVIEPENVKGIITKFDGKDLIIENNNLNLSKIYENYNYVVNNSLWLNSFVSEFKENNNSSIKSNNEEIIFEINNQNNNKYNVYKKLYVDKRSAKPTKMVIEDINQNTIIYIIYTKIEIS